MIDRLGRIGIVGVVVVIAGLALTALVNPLVAGGIALVLVGTALIVRGVVGYALEAMGMSGMV
ncbi:DUF7470 family protein [Halocatena pleomorpha]|uniref:Uncharacterized protein n=1 Tax=Halocatena pleomorpha TaxID=1785090 RepID=A0A3P3RBD4_9EURY|nr:hypothetical protein [Halocatena pleomorpha]RRJ30781.1 hypothetical protein EIK79_09120 [Halocatena pleomorpha]